MPFLILLFLVLMTLPLPWPAPWWGGGPWTSLGVTLGAFALPLLAAIGLTRSIVRGALDAEDHHGVLAERYARGRSILVLALMAIQGLAMGVLGWGWAVRELFHVADPDLLPFAAELLLIAPFLATLILTWFVYYSAENALLGFPAARPFGGRFGYVGFLIRQHLAVVGVPLTLMIVAQGLMRLVPELFEGSFYWLLPLLLVFCVLIISPWPLRWILGAKPLPPGPLRTRLEAAARRLKFRYSNLLLWNTHGGVANAMVAGPLPWIRYVFLSDRLLDELPPEEVEAVFGHEIGHVRHGHLLFYAVFMSLSMAALIGLWVLGVNVVLSYPEAEASLPADWTRWEALPQMALVALYVFFVFGFISRLCERQADIFGCRAVSCASLADCAGHPPDTPLTDGRHLCRTGIGTFIAALDRVAEINGLSRDRPGWLQAWLHGSIGQRVRFLQSVIDTPPRERQFQRRLRLLKWGWLALLVVIVVGLAWFNAD